MALGVAGAMGIPLMENFRTPYFSRSIGEFWRRWHISLSSWFRDYLYIPLGGSRRGSGRKYCNILIVFAVSGLWHGAGLTFLVWGLLNILANTGLDRGECLVALLCLAALLAVDLLSLRRRVCERFLTLPRPLRWVLVLALLLTVAVFGVYGTGYDAQDFIYFKF